MSELAELVTSGVIQVPKSLSHYQEDVVQLLDQIFTILSPNDIKGMLPDILKVFSNLHVFFYLLPEKLIYIFVYSLVH